MTEVLHQAKTLKSAERSALAILDLMPHQPMNTLSTPHAASHTLPVSLRPVRLRGCQLHQHAGCAVRMQNESHWKLGEQQGVSVLMFWTSGLVAR